MNRIHALAITLIVAIAVAVGGAAMTRNGTDGVPPAAAAAPSGATATGADDAALAQQIATREKALDALEASLNAQLASPTPAPAPRVKTVRLPAPRAAATTRHADDDGVDDGDRYEGDEEHEGGGADD